jgi:hypothetical protein
MVEEVKKEVAIASYIERYNVSRGAEEVERTSIDLS